MTTLYEHRRCLKESICTVNMSAHGDAVLLRHHLERRSAGSGQRVEPGARKSRNATTSRAPRRPSISIRRSPELVADDEFKLNALWEIVQTRLVRRNVPVKNLTRGTATPAANGTVRQEISLQQGIPTEKAKDIVKYLKDAKLKKVQASIQGDQVRVTSSSKDDLQEAMRQLREQDFSVALQFGNYRG